MKIRKNTALYSVNNRYLCPMKKEYLPLLKQWRNTQMKVLRQTRPLTDSDQKRWFNAMRHDADQAIFAILEAGETGALNFIGYCGITNIDRVNRRGELSFLVNPSRTRNKKVYKEDFLSSLCMLCQCGFEKLNLHKLYAETYIFRRYHIKILECFGLRREGVLREHKLVAGRWRGSIVHSILEKEWKKIKSW